MYDSQLKTLETSLVMPWTPLHTAAYDGDVDKVRELLERGRYDINEVNGYHKTPLHVACTWGHLNVARMLIGAFKADMTIQNRDGDTALMLAIQHDRNNVAHALLEDYQCPVDIRDNYGNTVLHYVCAKGKLDLARMLIAHKADFTIQNSKGATALMVVINKGHDNVAYALLEDYQCPVDIRDKHGDTVLHYACRANATQSMKTLIQKYKADKYLGNSSNDKSLQLSIAARSGDVDKVRRLLKDSGCDVNVTDNKNWTPLHYACTWGDLDMARMWIGTFKADMTIQDRYGITTLMLAIKHGHDNVAHALLEDYQCPVDIRDEDGNTELHYACGMGKLDLVRMLITHKADMTIPNEDGATALILAIKYGKDNVAHALIEDYQCPLDIRDKHGDTAFHYVCAGGKIDLARMLIAHKADMTIQGRDGSTALMVAIKYGHDSVAHALLEDYQCPVNCRGTYGNTVLHCTCEFNATQSMKTLIHKYKVDMYSTNNDNDTPLHEAAYNGQQEVALALIQDFGCDVNIKSFDGRSALHCACAGGHVDMVKCLSKYISPLVVDNYGNTPLHTCCECNKSECVEALLTLNAPVLIRNKHGKTPKEVTTYFIIRYSLELHTRSNKFMHIRYGNIKKRAKKRYSSSEHITRIFVLGNPGAGKSSFIASLKKEGFFESLQRVSESSVPPHTAGIVPSIHTSKHYGRVLFYDFAGDAEYYSSHAAILENFACTGKGDNIFIIVVDLREDSHKISCLLNYWVSFIQYQLFKVRKPQLVILGSHFDLVKGERGHKLCEIAKNGAFKPSGCFMLDCCNPNSNGVNSVVQHISTLVKDSPRFKLSQEATVLLCLLEMDFQHVTACPIETIISHIEDTKVCLPTDVQYLRPILHELHELGLLFMIKGDSDVQLVLNMSRLTHDVHQLLFSEEAIERLREKSGNASLFHVGIISEAVLSEVLPAHITKEILIQLQYCQAIHHKDVGTFSSSDQCDSSVQSYLFFPALCSAEKSDIAWVTPPSKLTCTSL